ncbi:MAG: MFS transporter [Proteobacteria bacterium]|nr:MFS transporter [Pseudomonadota bacterium]
MDARGAGELAAALKKTSIRLLPFLALLYFLAFLDRVNVSFAALQMNQDLGLSPFIYGLGAGIFFLSYVLFEVPSNLILHKVGARKWIARIMITWGLVSAGTAFITGPNSFIAARLLLGLAEAGFFPGIILYLTYWYPAEVRGKIIGAFMLAIPLSTVVGAPISTALLDMSVFGLKGWQTLFLLEGLPSVLMGIVTFFYLPDRPANATWLTEREREAITSRLAAEEQGSGREHRLGAVLGSPRLWLLGFVYFCIVLALYGLNFWTPLMVKSLSGLSNRDVGWLTAAPNLVAAIAMYVWGRWSDKTGKRRTFFLIPCLVGAAGFAVSVLAPSPVSGIAAIYLGTICVYLCAPIFWTLPTSMLAGAAAAGGIAVINSVGNVSGYLGPFLLGALQEKTGNYVGGFICLGASLLLAAALVLAAKNTKT